MMVTTQAAKKAAENTEEIFLYAFHNSVTSAYSL